MKISELMDIRQLKIIDMGIKNILLLLFAVLLSCLAKAQQPALTSLGKKGKMLWHDEFNDKGLPDAEKWGYEEGFVRNKERQYYTKARIENCYQADGNLVIESRKEKYDTAEYSSASINTQGKYSFEGDVRIEVRAKLPAGKGIWPAIWMMGTNRTQVGWPRCSEIDIMEFVGQTPGTVWGTLHWWDSAASDNKKHLSKGNKLLFDDLHINYHVYGVERKGNQIQLFVDDVIYFSYSAPPTAYPQTFVGPLYLLINTAIGGGWGGDIDDSIFPQKFYVDYVRAYKLK